VKVYRLSRRKYKDELSGYGASLNGQRWNSKGTEVIYTAQTRALANSEVAVHIPLGILPKDYFMVEIELPDSLTITELYSKDLPKGWNSLPAQPDSQAIGDQFVRENKFPALKVPSVVVKGEFNYILNPRHPEFCQIKITNTEPYPFDPRLFL
jgi:RES domain-containing protein